MRTPPNETLANETRDDPERRCIVSGDRGPKSGLVRLALSPEGIVAPDVRARAPGRGAWIGVDRAGLETAIAKGKLKSALARAFKTSAQAPADLPALTEAALARNALDRLGLEARSGTLLTGSDKIDEAARRGNVHLLLHAADAGQDGCRKLDQAWRVGSDRQSSGMMGTMLAADREALSSALGRENAVHIAIIDAGAARRVREAIDRWHYFIGLGQCTGLAESTAKVHGDAAHEVTGKVGLGE